MSKAVRARELQIDTILSGIEEFFESDTAAGRDLLQRFARRYLGNSTASELETLELEALAEDLQCAWAFVQERKSSRPLIGFESAAVQENGRHAPVTVVRVLLDDKPFIVDSLRQALLRTGCTIKGVRNAVLFSGRRKTGAKGEGFGRFGKLVDLAATSDDDFSAESFCTLVCARMSESKTKVVEQELRDTLNHVAAAVSGYPEMTAAAAHLRRSLLNNAEFLPVSEENVAESIEFIGWLIDNHFTFLGYEKYRIATREGESVIQLDSDSLLGVSQHKSELKSQTKVSSLPGAAADFINRPKLLSFAKSSKRSKVHRPAYYDYVLIKEFDREGRVTHMHRFLGLYTSSVYFREALAIPLLRKKVSRALEQSGYTKNGHNMKDLLQVINTFPRDELFQVSSTALLQTAVEIAKIRDTGASKIFVRKDFYGRFLTCLVYIPRELFNTKTRLAIQHFLGEKFEAEDVDFNTYLSESTQARIHFVFKVPKIRALRIDQARLERELIELIRPWEEDFLESLRQEHSEDVAQDQYARFGECFSTAYKETYSAREAVGDTWLIQQVADSGRLAVVLSDSSVGRAEYSFKLFSLESQLLLSDVDPILENLGLRIISERTFSLSASGSTDRADAPRIWLHDFLVYRSEANEKLGEEGKRDFEQAFYAVWESRADDDAYNALVLSARLDWRQAALLRAFGAYLKQIRFGYSQLFLAQTLGKHGAVSNDLVSLFLTLFSPEEKAREEKAERLRLRIVNAVDRVSNLSEDSVLRGFLAVIEATRRTNYFQLDSTEEQKDYFSFKFEPGKIKGVPRPVPLYEIFVFSNKVEGVHLRGGKVARGGLRWSDRREDYRTEVLGLVKAQQVKNAVIVPVGAKGGFVVKAAAPAVDRAESQARGVAAYKTFIRGLLDITDNLRDGELIPPARVVRRDGDDPYLVVAADKGTATFSDTANAIAASYDFWLGDGFASGGSNGYDHKAMGITAKGAWISVQRHFRDRGLNVQKEEFSVIGVGDMSGDVFGNGMLLSPKIRLIAAFNHLHIFVDPNPDPRASLRERKRLFNKAGSSWADYAAKCLSKGGGIFDRSAKSIAITPQMRAALAIDEKSLTPDELISAMLRAPVDLLWNGGIGTYVKSSSESHADVGDKANDSLRVDADELRCVAVGEGGNLGLTQLARVEYGLRGGLCFTDFVDNSGGVDCSDHEVNIKILLHEVAQSAKSKRGAKSAKAERERSELLESMTEEVSDLVLANNYSQVQTLALTFADTELGCKEFNDLIEFLEAEAGLDRGIEYLPTLEILERRKASGGSPTRAELAVATSYMKMYLKAELVNAAYLADSSLAAHLARAFPATLVQRFGDHVERHPLRAELMATQLANYVINRLGAFSLLELLRSSSAGTSEVVRAVLLSIEAFGAEKYWASIEALDYDVDSSLQNRMMLRVIRRIREGARWFLRNRIEGESLVDDAKPFVDGLASMRSMLPALLPASSQSRYGQEIDELSGAGVPKAVATAFVEYGYLAPALSLIDSAFETQESLETVTHAYYLMGESLSLDWLASFIDDITPNSVWEAQVRTSAIEDLAWRQRMLACRMLRETKGAETVRGRVEAWSEANSGALGRTASVLASLQTEAIPDLAMVTVAMRELKRLS